MPVPADKSFADVVTKRRDESLAGHTLVIEERVSDNAISTEKVQLSAITDITIIDDGDDVSLTEDYGTYQVLEETAFIGDGSTLLVTFTDEYDFSGTLVTQLAILYRIRLLNDDLGGVSEEEREQVVFSYFDLGGGDTFASRGQEANIPFVVTPADGVHYTLEFSFQRFRVDAGESISVTSEHRIIYIQSIKR